MPALEPDDILIDDGTPSAAARRLQLAIMAVAADDDLGLWPVLRYGLDKPAQVPWISLPEGVLPGCRRTGDRTVVAGKSSLWDFTKNSRTFTQASYDGRVRLTEAAHHPRPRLEKIR
jgi:hypothetical protein